MKIAVLSGKGGAGKTFVAVNLASVAQKSTYIDCDVEEPNGHLFLKPENVVEQKVYTYVPTLDSTKCDGCRKCVDFCHFNAIVLIKNKLKVFNDVCHFCGGCKLVCPNGAIYDEKREVGALQTGVHNNIQVVTGILNTGEASSIPVIKEALKIRKDSDVTIIDGPPGSACSVMESIDDADYCVLVAEPTAFGLHNFKMVHELVRLMGKKCGVVINKSDTTYQPLIDFCRESNTEILLDIPYDAKIAANNANGNIASETSEIMKDKFVELLSNIRKQVEQ